MKRNLLPKSLQRGLLAVPAAALMLGPAQAGTTIGLNFQAWYYDSGTTPQTIGYGQGYQTTGFPVTAPAFGVAPANWVNTEPLDCSSALDTSLALGSITVNLTAVNPWSGDIGNLVDPANEWTPGYQSTVLPGNDEATWGYEDNTGWTNTLSGLNTAFPNGYVIELVGAVKCTASSRVVVTDGVTTTTNAFDTIYTAGNVNFPGPVGLLTITNFTSDSLTFGAASRNIDSAQSCGLAGFIITDQPVVTKSPTNTTVNQGATLNLGAGVIGIEPLKYQWRLNGNPITDATNATYSVITADPTNAGSYDFVVTNTFGASTSAVASVTVFTAPALTVDLSGAASSIYAGANFSQWKVVAAGAEPLHYNWVRNGNTPVGLDSATLTLTNATTADSGDYSVTVTNLLGSAPSSTNHLTVVASPDLYTTDVAQDAPGSYWPLNETTGTSAYDYSGLGHTGTNTGGLTLGVNGPRPPSYQGFYAGKTAYQFDGASSYIDCGTGPSLSGTTDFTLEAWINTTATTPGQILQQRSATGFNGEYSLTVNASGNIAFTVYGGGYQFNNLTTPNSVNDGNWHYIAAVRRNGTNAVIYIDGKIAAAQTVAYIAPLDATIATYIGADTRDSLNYFDGSISDVAIYPIALSDNRIILHAYNGQYGNAPFAISIIPGGYIADSKPVGTPHSGLNNGATWVASSTDGAGTPVTRTGVEQFSAATGSQIAIPANSDFDSTTGSFTFWMRATAPIPGPGADAAILFDRRTTNGIVIALDDAGAIFVQSSPTTANTFSTGYLPDDLWHFVTVTYDQSLSGAIAVYIDGALSLSNPNATNWSWPTAQQLELGRSHDSYWKRYDGLMDDFRMYNRVLTAPEITSIYASGALVDTSTLKVRFDFATAGIGSSLTWPVGLLQSSPALGASALWAPVPNATSPYPFLSPQDAPTVPRLFYRAGF